MVYTAVFIGKNVDAVTFCTVTRGGFKVIEIM